MVAAIRRFKGARTPGWHGYDYVVNSRVISPTVTTLRRVSDGKLTQIPYRVHGSETEIAIPRARIGQTGRPRIAFDFHWTDNIPFGADISRFSLDGDSAPNGRFNYRFVKALPCE